MKVPTVPASTEAPGRAPLSTGSNQKEPLSSPQDLKVPLSLLLKERGIDLPLPQPSLLVEKSKRTLSIYSGKTLLRVYSVGFGPQPAGAKSKEGDGRTPEGDYFIASKESLPSNPGFGTRWMRIAYPNKKDTEEGLKAGLINQAQYQSILKSIAAGKLPDQKTPLGGGLGLHGASPKQIPDNFTRGCIGFFNPQLEELFEVIPVGTPITIKP